MHIIHREEGNWEITISGQGQPDRQALETFIVGGNRKMLFTISQIIVKHRVDGFAHKIDMIKDIRGVTALGLKDAKDFVDAICSNGTGMVP